jgi:hypothetical protein
MSSANGFSGCECILSWKYSVTVLLGRHGCVWGNARRESKAEEKNIKSGEGRDKLTIHRALAVVEGIWGHGGRACGCGCARKTRDEGDDEAMGGMEKRKAFLARGPSLLLKKDR